jgi:hypothetical protein
LSEAHGWSEALLARDHLPAQAVQVDGPSASYRRHTAWCAAQATDESSAGRCGAGEDIASSGLAAKPSAQVAITWQASCSFSGGLNANLGTDSFTLQVALSA